MQFRTIKDKSIVLGWSYCKKPHVFCGVTIPEGWCITVSEPHRPMKYYATGEADKHTSFLQLLLLRRTYTKGDAYVHEQ